MSSKKKSTPLLHALSKQFPTSVGKTSFQSTVTFSQRHFALHYFSSSLPSSSSPLLLRYFKLLLHLRPLTARNSISP